jgi:hypothetical protein
MLVQSFAYDRAGRRLEIFYPWKSAGLYGPISAPMFEEIARAVSINSVLDKWIKQRRITSFEVRTERKIVASMLCGCQTNVIGVDEEETQ